MNRNAHQIEKLLNSGSSVYAATFIFRRKNYDTEFEHLNNIITQVANSNKGFLGKESWSNSKENIQSVVYYWDSLQALTEFSNHPKHKKGKQQFTNGIAAMKWLFQRF